MLKDFDYNNFLTTISYVDYTKILIAISLLISTVYFRALRWKLFFIDSPKIDVLCKAQFIGSFGNNIFPLRIGEILKAYYVGVKCSKSKAKVIGTVILERFFDFLGCGFLLFLLYNSMLFSFINNQLLLAVSTILFVGVSGLVFALFFKKHLVLNTTSKIKLFMTRIISGITTFKKKDLFYCLLLTLLIWSIYILEVYYVQDAFNIKLNVFQCVLILLISSVSMIIPAMPGNFGTFEGSVIYTLSLFNIVDNFGFCFMLHLISYIPFTLIGFIYFIKDYKLLTNKIMRNNG